MAKLDERGSKLQQDILKIMSSYVGSNELYTDYGYLVPGLW
jgi:hypothetical protein